jgi:hypothetical protein
LAKSQLALSLDEVVDAVRRIVEQTCPGERVALLLHDWGCNRVIGLPTGHWVMAQQPKEFNNSLLAWLAETDEVTS